MTTSPPRISLRLTAKSTWDFNSVGIELELEDSVGPDESLDDAAERIYDWVYGTVEDKLVKFKEEVALEYEPKRTRNRQTGSRSNK